MAYDDMHVVMYKILAYLYDCMKKGVPPQESRIRHDSDMLRIPYPYWAQVIRELLDRKLIGGVGIAQTDDGGIFPVFDGPYVTLDGVEFLQDNSMMRKALAFLKEAKSTLPFI